MAHEWFSRAQAGYPTSIGERRTKIRVYTCSKCGSSIDGVMDFPPSPDLAVAWTRALDPLNCDETIACLLMES